MNKTLSNQVLAMVLAGGRGSRLKDLTKNRSKPAVPFGKHYIINFVLSNIINSKCVDHAFVLTQYRQQGILDLLAKMNFESPVWDKFIRPLPPQQALDDDWYIGSANAIYQNHHYIEEDPAEHVLILAADHIYKMDYRQLLENHILSNADVTVSGMFLDLATAAGNFGVMEVDIENNIKGFKEKPQFPKSHPGREGECVISQGIYIFKKSALLQILKEDHLDEKSEHDFGKNIIPKMVRADKLVRFYDHGTNVIPGEKINGYWRDVGTIDAYFEAMMDQTQFNPDLDLYNKNWMIITAGDNQPMYKVNALSCGAGDDERFQFLAAGGGVGTKAKKIRHSVLGRAVRVEEDATLINSIIFDKTIISKGAHIINTIVEEGLIIPENCVIGQNEKDDAERDIYITEKGIRVVHSESKL